MSKLLELDDVDAVYTDQQWLNLHLNNWIEVLVQLDPSIKLQHSMDKIPCSDDAAFLGTEGWLWRRVWRFSAYIFTFTMPEFLSQLGYCICKKTWILKIFIYEGHFIRLFSSINIIRINSWCLLAKWVNPRTDLKQPTIVRFKTQMEPTCVHAHVKQILFRTLQGWSCNLWAMFAPSTFWFFFIVITNLSSF